LSHSSSSRSPQRSSSPCQSLCRRYHRQQLCIYNRHSVRIVAFPHHHLYRRYHYRHPQHHYPHSQSTIILTINVN
jgi:hypothetical protein